MLGTEKLTGEPGFDVEITTLDLIPVEKHTAPGCRTIAEGNLLSNELNVSENGTDTAAFFISRLCYKSDEHSQPSSNVDRTLDVHQMDLALVCAAPLGGVQQ